MNDKVEFKVGEIVVSELDDFKDIEIITNITSNHIITKELINSHNSKYERLYNRNTLKHISQVIRFEHFHLRKLTLKEKIELCLK